MNAPLLLLAHAILAGAPVEMKVTACPLPAAKRAPACSFAPVEGAKGPFKRMERISCDAMNVATFVSSVGTPQLVVPMSFVEANTSMTVLFLRTPSGEVRVVPDGLSAIYFYHEPDFRDRSLGVWNVLEVIRSATERGLPFVYMGFHVEGCRSLEYKAAYQPNEALDAATGTWRPFADRGVG